MHQSMASCPLNSCCLGKQSIVVKKNNETKRQRSSPGVLSHLQSSIIIQGHHHRHHQHQHQSIQSSSNNTVGLLRHDEE